MEKLLFTKSERRSIIFLIGIGLAFQTYSIYLKPNNSLSIHPSLNDYLTSVNIETIDSSELVLLKQPKNNEKSKIGNEDSKDNTEFNNVMQERNSSFQLFNFDPNSLDSIGFIKLGLKPWTVKNILKYRNHNGVFKKSSDLQKIYSLDSITFDRIKGYCSIDSERLKPKKLLSKDNLPTSFKTNFVNINLADTSLLKTIYGIGPKLASRIIKYRKNIGGFHSVNQLTEVYGIEKEIIVKNSSILTCTGPLKKVSINTISKDSLVKHFYFNFKTANAILKYRKQHGKIESPDALNKIIAIDSLTKTKIKPYIDFT
ncbi:MAG: helix-hairpin-helix domain-containing protein [Bacteroidia bacterium]|nr:helix-hairpin-helix domain-containing protein [Bacteroidia bacterium]